jgi:hypothetical protein
MALDAWLAPETCASVADVGYDSDFDDTNPPTRILMVVCRQIKAAALEHQLHLCMKVFILSHGIRRVFFLSVSSRYFSSFLN